MPAHDDHLGLNQSIADGSGHGMRIISYLRDNHQDSWKKRGALQVYGLYAKVRERQSDYGWCVGMNHSLGLCPAVDG